MIDALLVTLSLDTTQFRRGQKQNTEDLQKSKEEANRAAKYIENSGKQAAQFFSRLRNEALMLFAAFTGANTLKQFAENVTASDAEMSRLARRLDMSTQDLTAWTNAIEISGGSGKAAAASFEGLEGHLQTLVTTGNDSLVPMFLSMGIAMTTMENGAVKARPLRDILIDIAKWTEGKDPAMVAQRLKSLGLDEGTINFLMKGAQAVKALKDQAEALGGTSDAEGKRAERLQSDWRALGVAAMSLGRTILNDLSPYVIGVLDQMVQWAAANRQWIDTKIHDAIQVVIQKATELYQYLSTVDWASVWKTLIEWVTQVQLQFGAWFDYLKDHWPEIKKFVIDLADDIAFTASVINKVVKATTGWGDVIKVVLAAWAIGKFAPIIGGLTAILRLVTGVTGGFRALIALATAPELLAAMAVYEGFRISQGAGQDELDKETMLHDKNMRDHPENVLGAAGSGPDPFKLWWKTHAPAFMGGLSGEKHMADPGKLHDYFLTQGWSENQVAGILASFKGESGFNAGAVGDNGKAAGLGQWRDERRAQFAKMFGHDLTVADPMEQAKFAQWELTHTEKSAGDALRATTSAEDAGMIVSRMYERPADKEGQAKLRGQYAKDLADAAARLSGPRNPVKDLNTGASASPALQNSINNTANNTTNTSTSEINVNGPITVNTKATDAKGIAAGLMGGLKSSLTVQQANGGLN